MSSTKTKVGIIVGITIIVGTGLFMGLPFLNSETNLQNLPHEDVKLQESEQRMLEFIEQQKAELEYKIGGKLAP
ncbi:MAG: hypothetical protein R3230_01935 [Nitrosopumilaceae archaeon]|nr:hypothetical protein [Nitrosopumilaceae archaeon]